MFLLEAPVKGMTIRLNKKIIGLAWFTIIMAGLFAYLIFPDTFNLTTLISVIGHHYWLAIIIYSLIICFRGLLFISPLSLTLASSVLFSPLTVFVINTLGVLVSTILIYKFSHFLGLDEYFQNKHLDKIDKIKKSLDKKEIPIIIIWSFLPLLPTDLIIYVSATLKIPLWKCLLGVFIGMTAINALIIYSLNFFLP
ncbi:MAG: TVP38/TMEM64 family protein [Patescibacteria group bacterium]